MKIVFDPGETSSLEERSVSYEGKSIIFKRGEPVLVVKELGDLLLLAPNNFKLAE
jgi:hypothetical protein